VPADIVARRKRGFPFGNLSDLLRTDGKTVRSRVLDSATVRRALPGVEAWLAHPPEYYRGPWEGTLWALLALGIWCQHHGVK
jgi:hypothetical protein